MSDPLAMRPGMSPAERNQVRSARRAFEAAELAQAKAHAAAHPVSESEKAALSATLVGLVEPYRLPTFRDPSSGRKVPMPSSRYTVLAVHGDDPAEKAVKAAAFTLLGDARRCARGLLKLAGVTSVLIARPAGLLDDPDFIETVTL